MAVKVKRERPDQRRHHRVGAPLFVSVAGCQVRAGDWSLGGLRVDAFPGDLPRAGSETVLTLTLPFQGFDVSFDVRAEVVRSVPATGMFSVRFIELGERERELMQHFVEELVRGSMVDVEDTIQRIDVPVTPASLEPDQKAIATIPLRRLPLKTILMTGMYAAIGFAVFGYAGLLAYTNFFRMEIQTAVISAPVEMVPAAADGRVAWSDVKPGDAVKAGDVVLNLFDNQLEREIELAGIDVEERKARLLYLKRRHADELERLKGFATVEMKNVQQTRVEVESLAAQLRIAEQQFARMKTLHEKGYATNVKLDEAERQVVSLTKTLEGRKIELASRLELADQNFGKRLYTGHEIVGTAADIEAQVRLAEHEIQLAQQRRISYLHQRERAAVTAPFDGTILDLPRADQGSVRRGDVIAVIEERRQRQVTAYLSQDEVMKVGFGDEALLYIPALGETLKGRVTAIDRTSGFVREQEDRKSPGYSWRGPTDRSAKVTIAFSDAKKVEDIERYRSGLPVVVVFAQRSTNALLSAIGRKLTLAL